jgi:hypothetical protein
MQADEVPLLAVPAIWDSGQGPRSVPCDVIVTNQRVMGYYSVSMPRKRLFLEDIELASFTAVSLRQKTFEPVFRELMVSAGQRKIYIRAPRRQIEALFAALREATEDYVPAGQPAFENEPEQEPQNTSRAAPMYGRQDIRTSFESSPLAIALLFVSGIVMEIVGIVLWAMSGSAQAGIPLFIAGLIAVLVATFAKRRR